MKALFGTVIGVALTWTASSHAADFAPSSFFVDRGTYSGGVSALTAAGDGRVLKLYSSSNARLSATFKFSAVATSSELVLNLAAQQTNPVGTFILETKDAAGLFQQIGTVTGLAVMQSKTLRLPLSAVINGGVTMRLRGAAAVDDVFLDKLVISNSAGVITVPPWTTDTSTNSVIKPPPSGRFLMDWQIGASSESAIVAPMGARVLDIDGFNVSAQKVAELKAQGIYTVCYINAGSWESYRPDSNLYPDYLKIYFDKAWNEWFLDVTDVFKPNSVLASILKNRFQMCKDKGFDAIEPDNLQNDENAGGLITLQQQLDFNSWLTDTAHAIGMPILQKNGPDKVLQKDSAGKMMVEKFDGILNEECQAYNECAPLSEYVKRGKFAVNVEYKGTLNCAQSTSLGVNYILKDLLLVGAKDKGYKLQSCP